MLRASCQGVLRIGPGRSSVRIILVHGRRCDGKKHDSVTAYRRGSRRDLSGAEGGGETPGGTLADCQQNRRGLNWPGVDIDIGAEAPRAARRRNMD